MIWSGAGAGWGAGAAGWLSCAVAAAERESSSGSAVQQTNVLRNAAPSARLALFVFAYRTLKARRQSSWALPLPRLRLHPKAPPTFAFQGWFQMQVRFADSRPAGDFALVLPVAGKDRSALSSLGPAQAAVVAALDRQRFEGEASSVAEQFVDDGGTLRRVLAVGTGGGSSPARRRRKARRRRSGAPADVGRKDRRHRLEWP